MKAKGEKLVSLFLVFSLMMLSVNLYAKERRGAKLIITKKDGQLIKGELITVKPNSLLLLDTEGKDVSIDIVDIKVIRIKKKSKALLGAGAGLLKGAGVGALGGALIWAIWFFPVAFLGVESWKVGNVASIGAGIGALLGTITGAIAAKDKTIRIEGMTDSEIQETLDKLRKKARIRDYK